VAEHIDIDALIAAATHGEMEDATPSAPPPPPGQRIALASDDAFSFVYPHLLAGWRKAGAEVRPFSPLANEGPDESADVCWLPGGYPERHAGKLAANRDFIEKLRVFADASPVHGECGGYMVLGETLEDADGETHEMPGLLGLRTSFAKRKMNLGYRLAQSLAPSLLGPVGTRCRGHEFHYSTVLAHGDDDPLFSISDANGIDLGQSGSRRGNVTGGFFHFIDAATPE
jgi:cobyrinic acid a,c-diamide synthase